MEYTAHAFENSAEGLKLKEALTRQLASQGFQVIDERIDESQQTPVKRSWSASIFSLLLSLAPPPLAKTVVTYRRDSLFCWSCGNGIRPANRVCVHCQTELSESTALRNRSAAQRIAENRQEAARRTAEIEKRVDELSGILADSLLQDHHFDWKLLREEFILPQPQPPILLDPPAKSAILVLGALLPIIENLLPFVRERRLEWRTTCEQVEQQNNAASAQFREDFETWANRRDSFEQEQTARVEAKKQLCLSKDPKTLLEYWKLVLERSRYPDNLPRSYTLDYAAEAQRLTIDLSLPPITFLPHVGEVKYNPIRKILEEVPVSDVWLSETYEEVAIQLALRTIYEILESDVVDAIGTIALHAHLPATDKFQDGEADRVVLSVEATKADFAGLKLAQTEPMTCFKRLGGVLSQNLAMGVPVVPIEREALETV